MTSHSVNLNLTASVDEPSHAKPNSYLTAPSSKQQQDAMVTMVRLAKRSLPAQDEKRDDLPVQKKPKHNNNNNNKRRVSFSPSCLVVPIERVTAEHEKQQAWYRMEDYSHFVFQAHQEAHVLRQAAECATSAQALFEFIQRNPDLNPRGLEKVLHHHAASDEDSDTSSDSEDSADSTEEILQDHTTTKASLSSHSKKIQLLKCRHRRTILSLHQVQKERGHSNPDELREFSQSSSQWAVQMALKLGHIDAHGLI